MWNTADIKKKKKYILDRLSNVLDPKEKERLEYSFLTLTAVLENSGSVRYTRLYNLLDRVSNDRFKLINDQKYAELEQKLFTEKELELDDEYVSFLYNMINNVDGYTGLSEVPELLPVKSTNEELKLIAKQFYTDLGDEEIEQAANKTLNNPSLLNFSPHYRKCFKDYGGIAFYDYVFKNVYCTVRKSDNIFDSLSCAHEVMHGVDFYMSEKLPSENYYGFHEVPTYTINYLFIDYLSSSNTSSEEVNKLKIHVDAYIQQLAIMILSRIKRQIICNKKVTGSYKASIENIKRALNNDIMRHILELQSAVMAYGLYLQIKNNHQQGINNLKTFMKSNIPKDKVPDFSHLGLSNEVLLELSNHIFDFSKNIDIVL